MLFFVILLRFLYLPPITTLNCVNNKVYFFRFGLPCLAFVKVNHFSPLVLRTGCGCD